MLLNNRGINNIAELRLAVSRRGYKGGFPGLAARPPVPHVISNNLVFLRIINYFRCTLFDLSYLSLLEYSQFSDAKSPQEWEKEDDEWKKRRRGSGRYSRCCCS